MSEASIRQLIDEKPISSLQLRVIFVCFALNMLDGFDVLAIAFTAPTISQEWQLTPYMLGIIFSAGLVGMALGAAFIAPLTDVIGRRAMILFSLSAIGVSMALTGLTTNTTEMIIMRIITGLGIGCILASLTSLVAEYTPHRKRSLGVGFMQVGYPLGATVGGFAAVTLIELSGWPAVFFLWQRAVVACGFLRLFFPAGIPGVSFHSATCECVAQD